MKKILFILTLILMIFGFAALGFVFAATETASTAVPVLYVSLWGIYITAAAMSEQLGASVGALIYWLFTLGLSVASAVMGEALSAGVIYRHIPYPAAAVFLPIGASGLPSGTAKVVTAVVAAIMCAVLIGVIAHIRASSALRLLVCVLPGVSVIGCMMINIVPYAEAMLGGGGDVDSLQVSVTAIYLLLWLSTLTLAIYASEGRVGIGFAIYWGACAVLSLLSLAFPSGMLPLSAIFLSPLFGLYRGSSVSGFFFVCFAASFVLCALSLSAILLSSGKRDGIVRIK